MTQTIRSAQRTSYPALMAFGIVYLATLAVVFGSDSLRAVPAGGVEAASVALRDGGL
ncbi:hypothetical protein [Albidovulum sediminis]|uniref:Uncharacterized protein n=1 Tax=Albidovulum sediminis TaxID=3066345 RepID=A0ABT2NQ09_9RHOB|nr:hypothetical protein [Defluviimonas sediminis]MCT8330796.1 hypothetical protein [Defluviimonas sediminis]